MYKMVKLDMYINNMHQVILI